ncbi:MAG: DDE-type integrase/transposase/recombinase [Candidatus Altiarchaeales archaeon]|nr:DDE-type integrase/transposase/recombinase [Candidatus Altiarchaeota archaeon]MCG2782342.1 DDE-type integrase/transposase/recombinase [Candidatus Altiarchaeales archaeon]
MKKPRKELVRRFAVKLRIIQRKRTSLVLKKVEERFGISISPRTLQRWVGLTKEGAWDFRDKSRRPKTIHRKLTNEFERWIIDYRKRTEYDARKIKHVLSRKHIHLSESTIKRVIAAYSLSRGSKMKGVKLKWVRWQRDTPNSLWQMDHTEENDRTLRFVVEDDCSRYCLAVKHYKRISTKHITKLLDRLIETYGKPRQILTDNGSIYQLQFDKWCKEQRIDHIKTKINKPTTVGKVEKLHDTYNREIHKYSCPEEFRYGYNAQRPHQSLDFKTPAEVYNEFHRLLFYKHRKPSGLKMRHMC